MPHAAIMRRKNVAPTGKRDLMDAVNRAMIEVLGVPDDSHPVMVNEYDADAFLIPEGCSERFTIVELTLFAGRTPETKKALFETIVARLDDLGIAAPDIRIIIREEPLENWGVQGGRPASEVELGFKVEI